MKVIIDNITLFKYMIEESQKVAENLGHTYIGTEHFLLACLKHKENMLAKHLIKFNITEEKVERTIENLIGKGYQTQLKEKDITPCYERIIQNLSSKQNTTTLSFLWDVNVQTSTAAQIIRHIFYS